MTRYKLTLEYDGTNTVGWQIQNGHGSDKYLSIQQLLTDAVFRFCGQQVAVVAAGRTDAGVHALGMAAHFDLTGDARHADTVKNALNFWLQDAGAPVAVLGAEIVPDDWHARFSCVRRNYRYVIVNRGAPTVLDKNRAWWVPRPLDVAAMQAAAAQLIGKHDFTSFRASECQARSPVKTLDELRIKKEELRIIIEVSAKSFLHHQVRNMVGTLVAIGLGRPYSIPEILAAHSRSAAGPNAPAHGLYFTSAEY
ncbi:MAG: tRNA pseudouridine(38-40) synthase TruA [Rickettsiales bacterium]|jgi:tRNA pseudouridine38-40 synthase|nr:tRNA pseudouridine(38-40) synthase TruA [Rickettsiales bacterium]